MRILLATEGESDEVVARHLIARQCGDDIHVVAKKFPARGFSIVRRAIPTLIKAAHYSHFDVLVVHFDLNSSLPHPWKSLTQSPRWKEVNDEMQSVTSVLPPLPTRGKLQVVLMTPCQATDAWVGWGAHGGSGDPTWWERRERAQLKIDLYGQPPYFGVVQKVREMLPKLTSRMDSTTSWPRTLRTFIDDLNAVITSAT